jgi:hypothetical protein
MIDDMGTTVGGESGRRMTITNDGDVEFTGTVTAADYVTPRSCALKTNIRTYENVLETVVCLKGVRFD